MKTLEDLFFGNTVPFELPAIDREERRRLGRELDEAEDPLIESMTPEQRRLYEDCQNVRIDISIVELRDAFIRGFRMGARVMLEVLSNEKKTFTE